MKNKISEIVHSFFSGKELKNAGWLIGGKIVNMIIAFVVSVFSARYLGPENYGVINYGLAYVAFFTSLCTLGLDSILIKDFVDHPDEQGTAVGTTLVLRAVSSFLSALMIFAIVSVLDRNDPTTIYVTLLCSLGLVFQVTGTFNYWFQSRYQSKVVAIATLVSFSVTALYRIVLLIMQKSVLWFAFATSVDYIVYGIFVWVAYKRNNGPKLHFSWPKGKAMLGISYHYILSGMMVALYNQTDKIMLKQMLGKAEVGYYGLAASINNMWVFVLVGVIDSMYPTIIALHAKDHKEFEKKCRQLYCLVTYLSVFVALCFTIFGKWAINLIYGSSYIPASAPLQIICWYTMFSYLGVARNSWIVSENKQKYLKYMYAIAAVCNVFMNWLFIPHWGASGAAMASLLTQILTSIVLAYCIPDMRPNAKLMLDAILLRGLK